MLTYTYLTRAQTSTAALTWSHRCVAGPHRLVSFSFTNNAQSLPSSERVRSCCLLYLASRKPASACPKPQSRRLYCRRPTGPTGNSCIKTRCRPMTRLHRWLRRFSLRLVSKIPSLFLLDPFSNRSSSCSFGSTSLFAGRPLGRSCACRTFFFFALAVDFAAPHPTLSRFSRPTSNRNPALTTQHASAVLFYSNV